MNLLTRLRLAPRLGLGFGFLLLMAALVALAQLGIRHVGASAGDIVGHAWPAADAAGSVNAYTRANACRTMELFFAADAAETARLRAHIADNRRIIDAALERLDRLAGGAGERAQLDRMRRLRASYVASFEKVGALLAQGQREEATALLKGQTLPAIDALQDGIVAINEQQRQRVEAAGRGIELQAG